MRIKYTLSKTIDTAGPVDKAKMVTIEITAEEDSNAVPRWWPDKYPKETSSLSTQMSLYTALREFVLARFAEEEEEEDAEAKHE